MTIYLKQSTASQEVPLGYFLDSTDGNTEETGLTINNTDIKLWKAGATTLANKNSGGGTHISNGIYYAVLDATDTNTLGSLVIFVHVSGALTVRLECVVLASAVYDWFIGGTGSPFSGVIDVNAIQLSGSSDAADKLEEGAESITPGTVQTGTLTVSQFSTNLAGTNTFQYRLRQLTFKGDTTTATLRGFSTWVTEYNGAGIVTVAPVLPVAPANGDTFVIT